MSAFLALQAGRVDRSTLTPAFSAALTAEAQRRMTALVAPYGTPAQFNLRAKTDIDGVRTYVFRLVWPQGTVDYVFGIDDKTDKIAKLYLRPGPPG